jgi:GT2 family glycosyltransferase
LNDQATALGVEYKFIVVDDNSTDGTVGELEGLDFPICVLRTSGNYFWARAMRLGVQSLDIGILDTVVFYNDDVVFYDDALERLLHLHVSNLDAVLTGAMVDSNGKLSYGGQKSKDKRNKCEFEIAPPDPNDVVVIDSFNMNLLLVPGRVLLEYGFFPAYFIHHSADFWYGYMLKLHKVRILLSPGFFGICDRNVDAEIINRHKSIVDNLRSFFHPKSYPIGQMKAYNIECNGILWGTLFFVYPILKIILTILKNKVFYQLENKN